MNNPARKPETGEELYIMKIYLHACCGPCTAYPLNVLRDEGLEVTACFYNPNIHPYREFRKRLEAMELFSRKAGLETEYIRDYGLREFLRRVVFHEDRRCGLCYAMRLHVVAGRARSAGADAFTTTLLYSKYQKHELIVKTAEKIADAHGIAFYYRDFRKGWQEGIDLSLEMGLYRQPYCGCIYSEQERYDKQLRKKKAEKR